MIAIGVEDASDRLLVLVKKRIGGAGCAGDAIVPRSRYARVHVHGV